jgi:hypothetical protein
MTSQQGRTRRWFLLVAVLGVAACRDAVAPRALTPPDPAAVIVDGAHNSGNDDVFFLPPLVDNPSSAPGFGDPEQLGLPVNIKINCLSHTATSACPNFNFPPSAVKSSSDAHYMVNWDTKTPGVDPGDVYRVEIHIGDKTLAWADVFLVPNGNPKNVATQGDIPLPDGRTLPIKIRIEKGWDCTNRSNKSQCATQVVPNVAVDGSGSTIVQFAGTDAEPAGGGRFYDGWIPYSDNCQPGSPSCVPTGTPVVVTIEDQTSLLNASGATCSLKDASGKPVTKMLTQLGTGDAQHAGRCVKFTTNPKFQFAKRVDVAVCVESPTPTQQLLKYDIGETPRFLQNVFFPIVCEPSTVGSTTRSRSANPAINYALNTLSRAGHALSEFFTPKSAYAIHLGVGGLIPPGGNGGGFSFVAPAEPYTESVVGEYQQTAVVNTSVPGPQSRITTVHPSSAPAVGQSVRCAITGGGGSLGSLGGPTNIIVQTQAVRNDAGAIVDAVATCPAWYLGPNPGVNTLQMVALSIDDTTKAAEDDGEGGTEIETLHGVTTFTATGTANLPDLTVANVTVGPASQYPGRNLNLNFQVRNGGGDMSANTSSAVLVAFSNDQTLSEDDATFGPFTVDAVKAGLFLNYSLFPAVPTNRTPGDQYILIIADPNGTLPESNEGNNLATIPVTVLQPQSASIDFETLPNEVPTCAFCDITSQYASRGVNFSWTDASTGRIQAPSLLVMPSRDDPKNVGNHLVSSPTTPNGEGGFSSGNLQLIFTNAPGYVSFIGAVNDGVPYSPTGSGDAPRYTVRAFDASGAPIPTANISVTVDSRYSSSSQVVFRRDFITVASARGISLVEIGQTDMAMLFDNLSFSTNPPIF